MKAASCAWCNSEMPPSKQVNGHSFTIICLIVWCSLGNLDGNSDINLQGQNVERVNTFKYLGATLAENGDLDAEMTHRIQTGWQNWKRVSGILCDRRISLRVKGKVYKTVVRPAMMYDAETWAVKKAQEKKLDVAEMRMLRWMSGVTKLDRIRNERIRGTTKVGEISKKVQESRLKWYGHVLRREDEYVGNRVMAMEVPGKRRRGRPKRRWLDSIGNDWSERELSREDAQDRARYVEASHKTHRPHMTVGQDEEKNNNNCLVFTAVAEWRGVVTPLMYAVAAWSRV